MKNINNNKEKKSIGFIIKEVLICVTILFFAFILVLLFSPIFDITNIKVEGNEKISENIILAESNICIGQNILRLNKIDIKNNLLNVAYIEDAKISRIWPDTIVINVVEKDSVGYVKLLGSNIYIDENGYILEIVTDSEISDVPFLSDIEASEMVINKELKCTNEELLKKYLEILKNFKNNDMLKNIVLLKYDDGIFVYTKNGNKILIGDINDLNYKILRLKAILENDTGNNFIDVSNPDTWSISRPIWEVTEDF